MIRSPPRVPKAGSITMWKGRYWSVTFHGIVALVIVPWMLVLLAIAGEALALEEGDAIVEFKVRVKTRLVGRADAPDEVAGTSEVMVVVMIS